VPRVAAGEAIGAAYLGGCALLIPNTLPIVLGTFRSVYELSDVQVGLVNTVYTAACFLVSVLAPFWLPRISARNGTLVASLLLVIATLALPHFDRLLLAFATVAIVGITAGTLSGIGNAVIGRQRDPSRFFGISSGIQLSLAAVFGLAAPLLIEPRFGASIALSFLAIGFLPGVISALFLADRAERPTSGWLIGRKGFFEGSTAQKLALIASFSGFVLYVIAAASFWIFVERIGEIQGIDEAWISIAVTAGIGSAMLGSALFTLGPQNLRAMIAVSMVLASGSYLAVLHASAFAIVFSLVTFNIAWGIAVPAFMSAIRALDFSNRYFVLATAALLLGSSLAGPPGGLVMQELGFTALIGICVVTNLSVVAVMAFALRGVSPGRASLAPPQAH
jgi:MFS family permease